MLIPLAYTKGYSNITETGSVLPKRLLEIVLETARPDMIYLLGRLYAQQNAESAFTINGNAPATVQRYYTLLLCSRDSTDCLANIRDAVAQKTAAICPVTAIATDPLEFYNWLATGHRFACTVINNAEVAYCSKSVNELQAPTADLVGKSGQLQSCFSTSSVAAREFFAGAQLFQLRQQLPFAAFMLHQAVEQVLRGRLEIAMGYRFISHNLDYLLHWAVLCNPEIQLILPGPKPEDVERFRLLRSAYIGPRYGNYSITGNQLSALLRRVEELLAWYQKKGSELPDSMVTGK